MDRQRYPIGQQNFQSIREGNQTYVDKTTLIYKLVNDNSKYVFLARPRRFGKSLLLSTIQAYFEGKKELFEGLAIYDLEKEWKKHPVFHLQLTRIDGCSFQSLKSLLDQQFREWEEDLEISPDNPELSPRFSKIIIKSVEKYGEKAVVLIDEYDNPLINTLNDKDLHEKSRNLLKSVYSNLKDLDGYLRFGMLTGVSRFSKMSIFSGLNNLDDISLDVKYSAICGITEEEVLANFQPGIRNIADTEGWSYEEAFAALKRNYDGYHFSEDSPDIYNPFSILTAFSKGKIGSYWFATGTPTFLVERIKEGDFDLPSLMNEEADSTELASTDTSHDSPLALLYQTGYLTIKDYDRDLDVYRLGVPNKEVDYGLSRELMRVYQYRDQSKGLKMVRNMVTALRKGEPDKFMAELQSYYAGIPYVVTGKVSELYFENNTYIICHLLGYFCGAEYATSDGRIDLLLQTDKYIYILELKLDGSVDDALKQIEEKEYASPFETEGKKIYKIGIDFSSESRRIKDWKIG